MNFIQAMRLVWIAGELEVRGHVTRGRLREAFGISTPQASKDFTLFQTMFPEAMVYDKSARHYAAGKPVKIPFRPQERVHVQSATEAIRGVVARMQA